MAEIGSTDAEAGAPQADSRRLVDLLRDSAGGDPKALDAFTELLYDELRRLARGQMRGERSSHTLQTTALVHEAYLRLAAAGIDPIDRPRFLGLAARTMRRVLIDHARAHGRSKRGGQVTRVCLDEARDVESMPAGSPDAVDVLAVDLALEQLARLDDRKAKVLELHVFGGLTYDELAAALDLSTATVHRELNFSRAWLRRELSTAGSANRPTA